MPQALSRLGFFATVTGREIYVRIDSGCQTSLPSQDPQHTADYLAGTDFDPPSRAITLAGGNTVDSTTGLPNGYAYSLSTYTTNWGDHAPSGVQLGEQGKQFARVLVGFSAVQVGYFGPVVADVVVCCCGMGKFHSSNH